MRSDYFTTCRSARFLFNPSRYHRSAHTEPVIHHFANRRKSVFAEAYDPENDPDDAEGANAIFPKSDEQRTRLVEAVKNILLFRALEPDQVCLMWCDCIWPLPLHTGCFSLPQMNQVLDAMFERKVTAEETVIKQGDDGDNFYVIES